MEAKGLRIGNWVNGNHSGFSKNVQVYNFTRNRLQHTDGKQTPLPIDKFSPIPLTEEILLKCALKKDGILYEQRKNSQFAVKEWSVGSIPQWLIFWGDSILHKVEPEYLHQLQNLYFALTGEELVVNL